MKRLLVLLALMLTGCTTYTTHAEKWYKDCLATEIAELECRERALTIRGQMPQYPWWIGIGGRR